MSKNIITEMVCDTVSFEGLKIQTPALKMTIFTKEPVPLKKHREWLGCMNDDVWLNFEPQTIRIDIITNDRIELYASDHFCDSIRIKKRADCNSLLGVGWLAICDLLGRVTLVKEKWTPYKTMNFDVLNEYFD